jgi:hypothetical protein
VSLGANFDTLQSKVNGKTAVQRYNQYNLGGLVFFDTAYVTADLSFSGNITTFAKSKFLQEWTAVSDNYELLGMNLGMGLYGKYPFSIGRLSLFPLLGAQAGLGLSQKASRSVGDVKKGKDYGQAQDWSAIALRTGVGCDFPIGTAMFIRGVLLFEYKLNSKLDEAFISKINNGGNTSTYNTNFGFDAKILVGYKFGSGAAPASRPKEKKEDDDIYYPSSY